MPRLPCRARSAAPVIEIFINYVSFKPYVSNVYFTIVSKTKNVFVSNYVFIDDYQWVWSLRATVKPSCARFDYHISVMFMIFRRLIL